MAIALLQARMTSRRLPGKVMTPILGMPMIGRQIERLRRAARLSEIRLATSVDPSDDDLAAYVKGLGLRVHRGSLEDVLDRFHGAVVGMPGEASILRLTADCPLTDPELVDRCIAEHEAAGADYTHSQDGWTYPKGLDVEVVRVSALETAWREATKAFDREHVTPFINTQPERFRLHKIRRDPPLRYRWTVDTPRDLDFVTAAYGALYPGKPDFSTQDVLDWQGRHPEQILINEVEP
jgi:spore coat polysaccharide biosynthesis protein SpsF